LSNADIGMMKRDAFGDVKTAAAKQTADIKQVGAANRLPEGSILSGIAGSAQSLGEGISKITPRLKEAQRRSKMDYYNLYQQYLNNKFQTELGYHNRDMGGLGALSKVAMLFSNGLI